LSLDGRENRAVANRAVGAEENEVVGEVGGSHAEVGLRVDRPLVLKVLTLVVDDGETGLEAGVEASGADKDINGIFVAIIAEAALLGHSRDLTVDDLDIGLGERLEVVDTRSETAAADAPLWNELLLEELVVEFLLHLGEHILAGILVYLVVLKEDAELAVQARLDTLAVVKKSARLVLELIKLFFGELVLLETLDWGDPGGLANEGGDFTAVLANGGQYLDTRGAT
jgi:hypothetical protein